VKLAPNLEAGQDQEVPDTRRVDHRGYEIDNSIQPQYDIIADDLRVDDEAGCVTAVSSVVLLGLRGSRVCSRRPLKGMGCVRL
jgi:hypothetical protein